MKKIVLVSLVFLLAACAKQSFVLSEQSSPVAAKHSHQAFILGGPAQTQRLYAGHVCGDKKVAQVVHEDDPIDIAIRWFQGVYTPRSSSVYCQK